MEWTGRRRGGTVAASPPGSAPSLAVVTEDPEAAADPKAWACREAPRLTHEAEATATIRVGLTDFDRSISDQLRAGLSGLLANLPALCRQVAARPVDARMGALTVRVNKISARIQAPVQALPAAGRMDALAAELGNLVLMLRAWGDGSAPDPRLRRPIATTDTRDTLLADRTARRVSAPWTVSGTREVTRSDGLLSQLTWLANRGLGPAFALLEDFLPPLPVAAPPPLSGQYLRNRTGVLPVEPPFTNADRVAENPG